MDGIKMCGFLDESIGLVDGLSSSSTSSSSSSLTVDLSNVWTYLVFYDPSLKIVF